MKEGSFSVEAALVTPVIVFVVLSLIFFGFYLRDIILIETTGRSLLIEAYDYSEAADILERGNYIKELLNECLWWAELKNFELSEGADYINYIMSANIFGINVSTENSIMATEYFNAKDKLRLWKSITDEARALFFDGGSTDES